MYSRYLPPDDAFLPLPQEESAPPPPGPEPAPSPRPVENNAPPPRGGPAGDVLGGAAHELNKLLGGLFQFSLEELDTGDILLALIVLFLFLEGDDTDLAIALGLALLLSLGGPQSGPSSPDDTAPSHPGG